MCTMLYNHVHMISINVSQARQNFSSVIDKVFAGEEFIVMKNNIKVAKIVPIKEIRQIKVKRKIDAKAFGMWKNRWPKNKSSVEIVNEWRKEILYGKYGD